jgi:hypothetical protein
MNKRMIDSEVEEEHMGRDNGMVTSVDLRKELSKRKMGREEEKDWMPN